MKKIVLSLATLLFASGMAFAGSDHFGSDFIPAAGSYPTAGSHSMVYGANAVDLSGTKSVTELASEINERFHVVPQAPFSRWPNTFSHIFAGGYAAGYYSYKWAEVLSADAYAAFEEAAQSASGSVLDQATGMRYRKEILEVGGSRPAMESFKAFRGREPNIDALLRHNGMTPGAAH